MKLVALFAVIAGAAAGVGIAVAQHDVSAGPALHAQATWNDKPAPPVALRDEGGKARALRNFAANPHRSFAHRTPSLAHANSRALTHA